MMHGTINIKKKVFKYFPNKVYVLMWAVRYVAYIPGLLCIGFSSASLKGKDHLDSLGTDGMINLEMAFTSKVDGCGLSLSGSGYRSIVASRETR